MKLFPVLLKHLTISCNRALGTFLGGHLSLFGMWPVQWKLFFTNKKGSSTLPEKNSAILSKTTHTSASELVGSLAKVQKLETKFVGLPLRHSQNPNQSKECGISLVFHIMCTLVPFFVNVPNQIFAATLFLTGNLLYYDTGKIFVFMQLTYD